MATKKVEEESKKKKNVSSKNTKSKTSTNKSVASKKNDSAKKTNTSKKEVKKEKVTKVKEEEKVVCEECGKEYLASLSKCPNCKDNKKDKYDDEDDYEYDEDFEEYDDEDEMEEEVVEPKIEKKEKIKEKEEKVKEEKKPKKKKRNNVTGDSFFEQNAELFSFLKILVVLVLLVGVVYLAVALVNGEFNGKEEELEEVEEEPATIQNEKILASSIFNKKDKEYYVLVYDSESVWSDYYAMIYSNYVSIEDEKLIPLFWVDLGDSFNKDVVVKENESTNKKAQKASDLKLKTPTLIHIKNGKNVDYWEGDKATNKLMKMIDSYSKDE